MRAAQTVFSETPYAEAALKDICALAGANVSLVSRYFGSKEMLFEEALSDALDVSLLMPAERHSFGVTLARLFTNDPAGRVNPLPMLIYASAQSSTRDTAIRLVNERVLRPFGKWIGGSEGQLLAAKVMALVTGYFTYRLILPLDPFVSGPEEPIEAWLGDSLQRLIDRG